MRQALVIFRKDLKHLWWMGAAMSALLVVHGWIDIRLEYSYFRTINTRLFDFEPCLLFLAWWCLVGVLIQEESTVGDRQYWLTRPISRRSLLAAKALFLVAFLCVPSFLTQTAVLTITGFPLPHYFGALLWNQVLIFSYCVMAGGIAAVTRNSRLYAVTSLAIVACFLVGSIWAANREGGQWEGVQWAQEAGSQIVFLCTVAAVFTLQYTARRTAVARWILCLGLVFASLLMWTNWWHTAFAMTTAVAGHADAATRQARIAFDPAATPQPEPVVSAGNPVRIAIPVRVSGIPPGRALSSERVSVTVESAGAAAWHSGWRVSSLVAAVEHWRNMNEWLSADGPYWLTFDMPRTYFDAVKDRPVRVQAGIALSEFTGPSITPLPVRRQQIPVAGVGHCGLDLLDATFTQVSCVTPFENRAAVDFLVQPHDGGEAWKVSGCCTISYVPFNTGGSFSLWGDVVLFPSHRLYPDDAVSIEMRRPIAFFERQVEIPDIVPARYRALFSEDR